jgi:hypothetical protein
MSTQERLFLELEQKKALVEKDEWKYYYFEILENFIYHIPNLKDRRTRNEAVIEIEKYLSLVGDKINSQSTKYEKGKELLPHLWKLGITYKNEAGFILKPNYVVVAILIIGLFLLTKLSFNTLISDHLMMIFFVFHLSVVKTDKKETSLRFLMTHYYRRIF